MFVRFIEGLIRIQGGICLDFYRFGVAVKNDTCLRRS